MAQIRCEYHRKGCRFAPQGQFEVKYAPVSPKILAETPKIEVIMHKKTFIKSALYAGSSGCPTQMQLIDTKIEISCMPNWALSNYFTHSVLIQIKIPLEVLFPLVREAFLLEEKNSGLNLKVGNSLHKVGGV
jgi:hypothetical protein